MGVEGTWVATRVCVPLPPAGPVWAGRGAGCGLGPHTIFFGGIFERTDCVWAVV